MERKRLLHLAVDQRALPLVLTFDRTNYKGRCFQSESTLCSCLNVEEFNSNI